MAWIPPRQLRRSNPDLLFDQMEELAAGGYTKLFESKQWDVCMDRRSRPKSRAIAEKN